MAKFDVCTGKFVMDTRSLLISRSFCV